MKKIQKMNNSEKDTKIKMRIYFKKNSRKRSLIVKR